MQDMMVQVKFFDISDEDRFGMRVGELVNPFTIDELGLSIEDSETIDVLVDRSRGDQAIFRINPAQVDHMVPVVRRNGQWVVIS
jgi:hypothetical protein